MSLFVDQSGDAPRISYSTTRTVTEYKTTCVRYETNSAGARVCALSQRDPVERKVSVSGTVHLTPVATP
jgi:hypothetical protein